MTHKNPDTWEVRMKKNRAHGAVSRAIKSGYLVRAKQCELCGIDDNPCCHYTSLPGGVNTFIVGHHWRGYDYPLDVWWICRGCNHTLMAYHNGEFTLETARDYVAKHGTSYLGLHGRCWKCAEDEIRKTDTYKMYVQRAQEVSGVVNDPFTDMLAIYFARLKG